jgi:ADP-heptose:LPS heptosyltransferase
LTNNNRNQIGTLRSVLRKIKSYADMLVYRILALMPISHQRKTLALVRVDGIGDYILFRNFISSLKQSAAYKDYDIYFIGNDLWKDLSLFLDAVYFHKSLWINKKLFLRNPIYRYYIFLKLRFVAVEIAVNPAYSRDFVDDSIIQAVNAGQKIGYRGDAANINEKQLRGSDKIYSKFIDPSVDAPIFEFYRNKDFFSQLLDEQLDIMKPSLAFNIDEKRGKCLLVNKAHYIVIFPGGGQVYKIWNYESYGKIVNHVLDFHDHHIYIAGSKRDAKHAAAILKYVEYPHERITNVTGTLNLVDLLYLLSQSSLYVGSDTGAAHMCACSGVPVISFFTGDHFGRFAPYPDYFQYTFISLYPPPVDLSKEHYQENVLMFRYSSPYTIQDILPETVIPYIDSILSCNS